VGEDNIPIDGANIWGDIGCACSTPFTNGFTLPTLGLMLVMLDDDDAVGVTEDRPFLEL
jgi:hypothetical protein